MYTWFHSTCEINILLCIILLVLDKGKYFMHVQPEGLKVTVFPANCVALNTLNYLPPTPVPHLSKLNTGGGRNNQNLQLNNYQHQLNKHSRNPFIHP